MSMTPGPIRAAALALALLICGGLGAPATAAELHVDPSARAGGDGSADRPFRAVAAALASGRVRDGDVLKLAAGDHGVLDVKAPRFERGVTIEGAGDGTARFRRIQLRQGAGLTFRDLLVMPPQGRPRGTRNPKPLVMVDDGTERVVLEGLEIRSAPDETLAGWTRPAQWLDNVWHGIRLGGRNHVVRDVRLFGVAHGIAAGGSDNVIEDNLIDGFAGDGMRGLGDRTVFRGNTVRNCFWLGDGNHDDGFQSWSRAPGGRPGSGVVRDVVLSGNRFLEWDRPEPHPLRCRLQGIGLFDGVYENWVIENNLVVVRQMNGITVMGGRGVEVINNTVLYAEPGPSLQPRIWMRPHKDGRVFGGNAVANNIAMDFRVPPDVQDVANLQAQYRGLVFGNEPGDHRPRPDGPAAGAADPAWQPATDIDGRPRPAGGGDLGAFQETGR